MLIRRGSAALTLVAALVLAGGCSSDDSGDSGPSSGDLDAVPSAGAGADSGADDGAGEPEPGPEEAALSEAECQPLLEARPRLVSAGNLMSAADDQETIDAMFSSGFDAVEADIALFRPYQDVEGVVFGTLRPGLDNLESDIAAIRDGRFDDRVFDYGLVAVAPVLEALGC